MAEGYRTVWPGLTHACPARSPEDGAEKVSPVRSEHIFPKRIYSPVGGWVLTMFLVLIECSYVGSLCYEIFVQYHSPLGRVCDAPWMAMFATPPAMPFVLVIGIVPASICYIVLRASSLKRRLILSTRLWLGGVFGTVTAALFYAVLGVTPDYRQAALPLVAGFVISSMIVMVTISVRWLGVDPAEDGSATR